VKLDWSDLNWFWRRAMAPRRRGVRQNIFQTYFYSCDCSLRDETKFWYIHIHTYIHIYIYKYISIISYLDDTLWYYSYIYIYIYIYTGRIKFFADPFIFISIFTNLKCIFLMIIISWCVFKSSAVLFSMLYKANYNLITVYQRIKRMMMIHYMKNYNDL